MKIHKAGWLFLVLCFSVIMSLSDSVWAEDKCETLSRAEEIIKILNEDPFMGGKMGFVFEQDGVVLWFHTGKSAAEIGGDWIQYGRLVQGISRNWKAVTGCGIVVGIDSDAMIAFATDYYGNFHMSVTPEKHKDDKSNEHKNPRILITF